MVGQKNAKIWNFFKIVNVDGIEFRKCLISSKCKLLPTPKDSSTGNMINHLKASGHEAALKEYHKEGTNEESTIVNFG